MGLMKHKATLIRTVMIVGALGGFLVLPLGSEAAFAQSIKKNYLPMYATTKGNKLAIEAARAMAAKDCKGKLITSAPKPNKNGGWVNFICESGEWAVIIHFKYVPGGPLLPDKFSYAG